MELSWARLAWLVSEEDGLADLRVWMDGLGLKRGSLRGSCEWSG